MRLASARTVIQGISALPPSAMLHTYLWLERGGALHGFGIILPRYTQATAVNRACADLQLQGTAAWCEQPRDHLNLTQ